jgi:hypothetical protein
MARLYAGRRQFFTAVMGPPNWVILRFSESVGDPDHQDYEEDADKYCRIKTSFKNAFNDLTGTEEE